MAAYRDSGELAIQCAPPLSCVYSCILHQDGKHGGDEYVQAVSWWESAFQLRTKMQAPTFKQLEEASSL